MGRFLLLLSVSTIFVSFCFAEVSDYPAVKTALETLEKEDLSVISEYTAGIKKRLAAAQERGNLNLCLSLNKELDDLEALSDFSPSKFFDGNGDTARKTAAGKLKQNQKKFESVLEGIVRELTKNGKLNEAQELQEYLNTIRNSGIVPKPSPKPVLKLVQKPKSVAEVQERLWNVPVAKIKTKFSDKPRTWAGMGSFTPDSRKFLVLEHWENKTIFVFDIETGKVITKANPFDSIAVSPNNFVASSSKDSKLVFWNFNDGSILREIEIQGIGHGDSTFNTDGSLFAIHVKSFKPRPIHPVIIYDIKFGKELMRINVPPIDRCCFSPNGKTLATAAQNGEVVLWDVKTGKSLMVFTGHKPMEMHLGLSFNHQGNILASGGNDSTVLFWDVKTGRLLKRMEGFRSGIACLDFSPDDSQLLIGGKTAQETSVWDIQTGLPLYRLPSPSGYDSTAIFSPDGKTIATCSRDPVTIWEVPTQTDLKQWEHELKNEQDTAKEISLIKMPLKTFRCDLFFMSLQYDLYSSSRKDFENSIFAYAPSKYAYRLDKKWKIFKTSYGIQLGTSLDGDKATCIFIVKGDGKELFRSEVVHDCIDRALELDVRHIEELELIVDPNGKSEDDQGIWFSPMLYR